LGTNLGLKGLTQVQIKGGTKRATLIQTMIGEKSKRTIIVVNKESSFVVVGSPLLLV
jgi:hypothetical protein